MPSPISILIPDKNAEFAPHLHEKIREAEAIIPERHLCAASFRDERIDERERLIDMDEDDPIRYTDLRRSNASTKPIPAFEFVKRVSEIIDERAEPLRAERFHRSAFHPERWVAKLEDFADWHDGFAGLIERNVMDSRGGGKLPRSGFCGIFGGGLQHNN